MSSSSAVAVSRRTGPPPGVWPPASSVEDRLLVTCARVHLPQRLERHLGSLLQQPLDWEEVRRSGAWHRLSGLLYHHLRRPAYARSVPLDTLAELKGIYVSTSARHLCYRAELSRVLEALLAREIQAIVLKGAALVGAVYREPGMRPMADIDLLVPRTRIFEAQSIVRRLGYAPVESDHRPAHWVHHQHLPRLVGKGMPVTIEIHGHVVRWDSPLAFDIGGFWKRARPGRFDDVPARVLAPEDLLLHLCLNFFRDRRFQSKRALGQLCDIAEVARRYEPLRWNTIVGRGRRDGIAGPLACSLRLAGVLLDAPVPEWVVPALAPAMSDHEVASFARCRVVTTRQWVTTELVRPDERYGGVSLVRGIVRRIMPTRENLRVRHGTAGNGTYWGRIGRAAQVFGRLVQRPSELREDLSVARWMHSLNGSGDPGA